MLKLPTLEELSSAKSKDTEDINVLNTRFLKNIDKIKELEKDNTYLKNIILEKKEAQSRDKRIDAVIDILKKKEFQFSILRKKLVEDYQRLVKYYSLENKKIKEKSLFSIEVAKKLRESNKILTERNIKTKYLLKQMYERKLDKLGGDVKLYRNSHKNILKQHETFKINTKKDFEILKQKNAFLSKKNQELFKLSEDIENQNKKLLINNRKLLEEINKLNSVASEEIIEKRTLDIKKHFEEKSKTIAKQYLEKEIELRSRIDSLNLDLKKYYNELNELKHKYLSREQELKEKLKDFL